MKELSLKFPQIDLHLWPSLLKENSEMVYPTALPKPVCTDPDDDKFIACALAGKTLYIVSGDKSLLKTSGYQGIIVLKPKEFETRFLKTST